MAVAPAVVYRAVLEGHPISPQARAQVEAYLEGMDRRTRPDMRILLGIRAVVGTATRRLRVRYLPSNRWHLRSTPPPGVVAAFPELGLGRAVPPVSTEPEGDGRHARPEEPEPLSGGDAEQSKSRG